MWVQNRNLLIQKVTNNEVYNIGGNTPPFCWLLGQIG